MIWVMHEMKKQHQNFESIRHLDESGNEYWLARELADILDYVQWRNFIQVIEKAKEACENSGQVSENHFADVGKMVGIGSGALRPVDDLKLSRYEPEVIWVTPGRRLRQWNKSVHTLVDMTQDVSPICSAICIRKKKGVRLMNGIWKKSYICMKTDASRTGVPTWTDGAAYRT